MLREPRHDRMAGRQHASTSLLHSVFHDAYFFLDGTYRPFNRSVALRAADGRVSQNCFPCPLGFRPAAQLFQGGLLVALQEDALVTQEDALVTARAAPSPLPPFLLTTCANTALLSPSWTTRTFNCSSPFFPTKQ